MTTLDDLKPDLDAYEACRESLEADHAGQFVVFHAARFEGPHPSFHDAAKDAAARFRDAPFLIRQVGADRTVSLPFALSLGVRDAGR